MNTVHARYSLNEASKGQLFIYDPIGWDTCPISLLREKDYSEVIEVMDAPFTFIGPAIDYLLECEAMGIDTSVTLLVEVTEDQGQTFELFYQGLVNLPTKNDLLYPTQFKLQYNVKKTDMWSAFYNRKSNAVDIKSTTDQDGGAIAPATAITVPMPSQVVDRVSKCRFTPSSAVADPTNPAYGYLSWDFSVVNKYGAIDLPEAVFEEVKTKFHLPNGTGPDFPPWLVEVDENGVFDFDISINLYQYIAPAVDYPTVLHYFDFFLAYGNDVTGVNLTKVPLVRTDIPIGVPTIVGYSNFSLVLPGIALNVKDKVWLYIEWIYPGLVGTVTYNIFQDLGGLTNPNQYIKITNHSTFPDSVAEGYLIHDVIDGIVKRISPATSLYSPLLGMTTHGYPSNGCAAPYALLQGKQIRLSNLGPIIANEPFPMSLDDAWESLNPLQNLGLGIENVAGTDRIYIDEKRKFYDSSGYSIQIPNVEPISATHKLDAVYKSIDSGSSKWQLSSGGSQIDDAGPHKSVSPARLIGQQISIITKWIIASLLFELTRRAAIKPGETWDLDNEIFYLKMKTDMTGPDLTGAATDLLNAATRYNKTVTPARMFLKWLNVLNVGLSQYIGHPLTPSFKFVSGLGNFLFGVTVATPCEVGGAVIENADVPVTSDALLGTDVIDFDWPLSWTAYKLIRDSKRKMIGVASDSSTYSYYFIQKIDFFIFKGNAKFTLIKCPNPFET